LNGELMQDGGLLMSTKNTLLKVAEYVKK